MPEEFSQTALVFRVGGIPFALRIGQVREVVPFVALRAGFYDMVRASIIGSILANLMLATGLAFFLGGQPIRPGF